MESDLLTTVFQREFKEEQRRLGQEDQIKAPDSLGKMERSHRDTWSKVLSWFPLQVEISKMVEKSWKSKKYSPKNKHQSCGGQDGTWGCACMTKFRGLQPNLLLQEGLLTVMTTSKCREGGKKTGIIIASYCNYSNPKSDKTHRPGFATGLCLHWAILLHPLLQVGHTAGPAPGKWTQTNQRQQLPKLIKCCNLRASMLQSFLTPY